MTKTPGQIAEGTAAHALKVGLPADFFSDEQIIDMANDVIAADRPQIEAEARANAVEAVKQFILGGRFLHDQAPGKLFAQEVTKEITNQGIGLAALPPTHVVIEKPAVPIVADGLRIVSGYGGNAEGIRDDHGHKVFFPYLHRYQGQDERYERECAQLQSCAQFILNALLAASKGDK